MAFWPSWHCWPSRSEQGGQGGQGVQRPKRLELGRRRPRVGRTTTGRSRRPERGRVIERCPTCKSVLLWSGLRLVCGCVACPGDPQTRLDVVHRGAISTRGGGTGRRPCRPVGGLDPGEGFEATLHARPTCPILRAAFRGSQRWRDAARSLGHADQPDVRHEGDVKHYPPKKPRSPDGSWGRHWLPRGEQAKFRAALLELAGPNPACADCGRTGVKLQAHHVTRTSGRLLCQSCHNRETQENQFNGNPPPLP